ncbi:UPF0058 family protein [Methanosarcina mazei]|nr:UPF0058 family protein [Methanosarcina mazei]
MSPVHIHRSKADHKRAIFILCVTFMYECREITTIWYDFTLWC